jgi:hypothetical protein
LISFKKVNKCFKGLEKLQKNEIFTIAFNAVFNEPYNARERYKTVENVHNLNILYFEFRTKIFKNALECYRTE